MPFRFNVPQPFAVPQQQPVGSMFQQPAAQPSGPLTGNFQPWYQQPAAQPMPQRGQDNYFQRPMQQPVAWNQHPVQQQNYAQPVPQPHPLTGNFQPMGQPQATQQLTHTDGQPAMFNPALANPTPYMGKTMQPQGVYNESVPDYNPQPMPATGINALGFGTQPTPMPTVTR